MSRIVPVILIRQDCCSVYPSAIDAAEAVGVDRRAVSRAIDKGNPIPGVAPETYADFAFVPKEEEEDLLEIAMSNIISRRLRLAGCKGGRDAI